MVAEPARSFRDHEEVSESLPCSRGGRSPRGVLLPERNQRAAWRLGSGSARLAVRLSFAGTSPVMIAAHSPATAVANTTWSSRSRHAGGSSVSGVTSVNVSAKHRSSLLLTRSQSRTADGRSGIAPFQITLNCAALVIRLRAEESTPGPGRHIHTSAPTRTTPSARLGTLANTTAAFTMITK